MKIRLRENLTSETYYRQKFPDLRYLLEYIVVASIAFTVHKQPLVT
jgi:hypothetical protein